MELFENYTNVRVFLLLSVLFVLLISISITDLRHGIIPDRMNAAIASAGLLKTSLDIGPSLSEATLAAVLTLCTFTAVRTLFECWRGHPGIGLGDVKFLAAASTWTGFVGLPTMILVASLSGLTLVVLRGLAGYSMSRTTRLPFGPHLAVGLATVCLFGSTN